MLVPWEVIVVDNASTDNTADVATHLWPSNHPNPLRVVSQPKLGLSHARARGFEEARYEFVSFVDDDNWVAPDWVETVYKVMMEQQAAGACGGQSEAVFEITPPAWFKRHEGKYAVGSQSDASSDATWTKGHLWGAGLTIRKTAWNSLLSAGFQPLLTGRTGGRLMAGEDTEICLALRLAGWRLWYDERLGFQHFIPSGRLDWGYLKRLVRGFGAASVLSAPYHLTLVQDVNDLRGWTGKIWLWKLRSELEFLLELEQKRFPKRFLEGDDRELERQRLIGSIQELLRMRGKFDSYVYAVCNAKWNLIRNQQANHYAQVESS